jgi:hypothetical protein
LDTTALDFEMMPCGRCGHQLFCADRQSSRSDSDSRSSGSGGQSWNGSGSGWHDPADRSWYEKGNNYDKYDRWYQKHSQRGKWETLPRQHKGGARSGANGRSSGSDLDSRSSGCGGQSWYATGSSWHAWSDRCWYEKGDNYDKCDKWYQDYPQHGKWEGIEKGEEKVAVQGAVVGEREEALSGKVDLNCLSKEVVEWVNASRHAQFRVENRKLVVLFRATGHRSVPQLSALQTYEKGAAHEQASAQLDYCLQEGLVEESDFAGAQSEQGLRALISSFNTLRKVRVNRLLSNHGRARKRAASQNASRVETKIERGVGTSEKGEALAARDVVVKQEEEDSRSDVEQEMKRMTPWRG